MKAHLTKLQAQDVLHVMGKLADSEDLCADYHLTQAQAEVICSSIPRQGGNWEVPDFALKAVAEELQDYATILTDVLAADACSECQIGQALAFVREAIALENIAEVLNNER